MLTQLRLLSRAYIPIKPVLVMPREVKRLKRIEARKRNKLRRTREETLLALQLPLVTDNLWYPVEDRTEVDVVFEFTGPNAIGIGPEIDGAVGWDNDELLRLHAVLLEESLKALAAKGNPAEKLDVLDWMFEPDFFAEIVKQTPYGPRKRLIYNDQVPFSFAFCCKLQGHDPSKYRGFVRRSIPDVVKRYMHFDGEDSPLLQEVLMPHRLPY